MGLFADHSRHRHNLLYRIGGGIRVAAVVLRELRGVGNPGDGGDAAGDDLGGLFPMISVVCPRSWVAMEVQPVAVTTVAPVFSWIVISCFAMIVSFSLFYVCFDCCWLLVGG